MPGIRIRKHSKGSKVIHEIILKTKQAKAHLLDYGAAISKILLKKGDQDVDIVLGFDTPFQYKDDASNPYFGAIIGRTCNRIQNGEFSLDGQKYSLPINSAPNSLHGGLVGFDKSIWEHRVNANDNYVEFWLFSDHLDQGYPGKINVTVRYQLVDCKLIITTSAVLIDELISKTIVNLTSHPYFNLGCGSIEDLVVEMNGVDGCIELDENQIPMTIPQSIESKIHDEAIILKQVAILTIETNPEFFFDGTCSIGSRLPLVQRFKGFDHFYLHSNNESSPFIKIKAPDGIFLLVSASNPGFQFYTGNWVDVEHGKNEQHYKQYSGVCIEPSQPPNAINLHSYRDSVIVTKDKPWVSSITYEFGYNELEVEEQLATMEGGRAEQMKPKTIENETVHKGTTEHHDSETEPKSDQDMGDSSMMEDVH